MNNYDEVTYKLDVPEALTAGQILTGTDANFGKQSAIVEVVDDGEKTVLNVISLHDRTDLATKKANKLAREMSKVAGGNLVDYIVADAVALPRTNTYFGENGEYGNADNIVAFDTTDWTDRMWERIRWNPRKLETAKHFYNKEHKMVEASYWTSPTSGLVKGLRCEESYLRPDELNL